MKSTRPLVFIVFLVLAACSQRMELVEGSGLVALEHAAIVDGAGALPWADRVVLLEGGSNPESRPLRCVLPWYEMRSSETVLKPTLWIVCGPYNAREPGYQDNEPPRR